METISITMTSINVQLELHEKNSILYWYVNIGKDWIEFKGAFVQTTTLLNNSQAKIIELIRYLLIEFSRRNKRLR